MTKSIRTRAILTFCLCIFVLWGQNAYAQEPSFTRVWFSSDPVGASIILNNKTLGLTPVELQLPSGVYAIEFTLPGFDTRVEKVVVYGPERRVFVPLHAGTDLIELPTQPFKVMWASHSNQLRFASLNDRGDTIFFTYDLDAGNIVNDTKPLYWVEDTNLRQSLGIANPGKNNMFAIAYQSPSHRYVAYISKTEPSVLTFFDTQLKQNLATTIQFPEIADEIDPPFYLNWSQHETALWVVFQPEPTPFFVFINDGKIETIYLDKFQTEDGKTVYTTNAAARPAEQKLAIVWGYIENQAPQLWLVDLKTKIGKAFQLEGLSAAAFSLDDQFIYLAYKDGIGRVKPSKIEDVETISEVPSIRWGVSRPSFSATADYLFFIAGNSESPTYWLYKISK